MPDNKVRVSIVTEMTGDGIAKARGELDALEKKLPGATEGVEKHGRAHKTLADLSGNAGTKINELAAEFTGKLGPAGDKVQAGIEKLTGKIGGMSAGSAAAVGGVAVLGAALVTVGKSGVDAFLELAEKTKAFQEAAGTTAEDSSILVDALDDLGIGSDVGAAAMARLAKTAELTPQKLEDVGIAIAHTKDGAYDAYGSLENVAEAFAHTDDQGRKAAIGSAAFGRSWYQLAPLLQGGKKNLEEIRVEAQKLGIVMSQDDVDAAFEFKQNMVALHDSLDGVKIAIGRGLVPELTKEASGLTNINEHLESATHGHINLSTFSTAAFKSLTGGIGPVLGLFAKEKDATDEVVGSTIELANASGTVTRSLSPFKDATIATKDEQDKYTDSIKSAIAYMKEYDERIKDAAKSIADMQKAQEDGASKQLAYESSTLATSNAMHDLTEKTTATTTAIAEHGAESEEARKAQADLDGQVISTKQAFIQQGQAAVDLAVNTAAVSGQSLNAEQKAAAQRAEYQRLASTMEPGSPLRVYLQGLIDKLNNLPTQKTINVDINQNFRSSGVNQTGGVTVMASGGTTGTSGDVIVGERGPERLRLPAGSEVTPNHLLGGGGGGNTYNVYVESQADADEIGRAIAWHTRFAGV